MAQLDIVGLSKRYGETVALSGVDLAVQDGEFLAIYGPPGAGKSTILKLVSGVEEPDRGQYRSVAGI